LGRISISLRIDAPVVVNPEVVSKKALIKELIESVNKNGRVPKSDIINHPNETMAKPSFARISPLIFVSIKIIRPDETVIKKERNIPDHSLSL